MKYFLLLILLSLFLVGCGPKTSDENRSPGELAFRRNCQSCHALPKPTDKTDVEWDRLVLKYGQKIKLNQQKIELITNYLKANN